MNNQESIGRMLGCLHRNAKKYFHKEFSKLALASGSHAFLMMLYQHDGVHQNDLSYTLHFDKAHTTRAIQKLVELGYIRKESDPGDHRAYRIYLTDRAKAIEPEIKRVLCSWSSIITNGFSKDEKHLTLELLSKMIANVEDFMRTKK